MSKNPFSFRRLIALLRKEWKQTKRDPMTLRFIIAMPIMQLLLFGYAINTNPKHLPTGLLLTEHSQYERTIVSALRNTGYYDIKIMRSETEADKMLAEGKMLFIINIPPGFDRAVDRGEVPSVLIDADGTDPSAIGNATSALQGLGTVLNRDLPPARQFRPGTPPFKFIVHARYNPDQITVLNTVPGLICIVLVMSTLLLTTLAITREHERGTMENLLAMPVKPIEVMLAKIIPYIGIGYLQVLLILIISAVLFGLPVKGSLLLLLIALGLFVASNLALGIMFSTMSANQMQATQMSQFALMPFIMLSGFMFPFQGMPVWAQYIGEMLPTTHAVRIVRGLLLKGNSAADVLPELWPIALFTLLAIALAVHFYRETLD
ncbi:MAG TPA: ABC transporter permease [Rickettsiales bacterium]|nr:ABC transporter permease [Rickettsiales bacterium]